jgi:WD40 repeat protein
MSSSSLSSSDSEDEVKSLDDGDELSVEEKIERGRAPLTLKNDDIENVHQIASYRHTIGSGAVGIDKSRTILSSCLCSQRVLKKRRRKKSNDSSESSGSEEDDEEEHCQDEEEEDDDDDEICTIDVAFFGTADGFVHCWSVKAERRLARFRAHNDDIVALCSSNNGQRVWIACVDGSMSVWRVDDYVCVRVIDNAHDGERLDVMCAVGDDRAWTCSGDAASLCVWSTSADDNDDDDVQLARVEHDALRGAATMSWHKPSSRVWIGTCKGYILALDALAQPNLDALEEIRWRAHSAKVASIVGVGDSQVWSASDDRRIRCWSARSFSLLRSLRAHSESIGALQVFGSDYVASADSAGNIMLWPQRAHAMQPKDPYARSLLLCPVARNRWARHNGAINTMLSMSAKHRVAGKSEESNVRFASDTYALWSSGADTAIHLWQLDNVAKKKRRKQRRDKSPSTSTLKRAKGRKKRKSNASSSVAGTAASSSSSSSSSSRRRHRSKHKK